MAVRARLSAPRQPRQDWNYHSLRAASLPASMLFGGDRRMEADNFLAPGFATRRAILAKQKGWSPMRDVAVTWQPSRLKGIQVSPEFGSPFLAATQVYDLRPVPRKWLSLDRTEDYATRFVEPRTILVTCSGTVGRATIADASIQDILVSHDLLRVQPKDLANRGWLYAYLRAPSVRAMMMSAQYGHMIKHLEVSHLDSLPFIACPSDELRRRCDDLLEKVVSSRDTALSEIRLAEQTFEAQFPAGTLPNADEPGFVVQAGPTLMRGRRRFDAYRSNPLVREIERRLTTNAIAMTSLREVGCEAWLPNRFRRVPADDGVELVDSSSIFEINPDQRRRIAPGGVSDRNRGHVEPGWLMMSRSGQVYGLLGSVVMATSNHAGKIVTDDVIRIVSGPEVDAGYLQLVLSHELLGRPRVKSLAYGSSIPHIEPEDLLDLQIPRLPDPVEAICGNAVRRAFDLWSKADQLEADLAAIAEDAVTEFLRAV